MRGALHLLEMVCLDADVARWVTVGRLWASLRVAMVAFFIWSGGFRFGVLMVLGSGVSQYVCMWVRVAAM